MQPRQDCLKIDLVGTVITPIPAVLATVLATVCHVTCKFSFFLVI
jgi:hypothetical protein